MFDDTDVHQVELLASSLSSALRHADDFTVNTTLLAERTAALAKVEAANQLKLDLIGMLGHEIGTPLAAIIGSAEVASEDWAELSEERRYRLLDVITRQAHRMDRLVREVLTMVTLDAGQMHARRQPVPLLPAIRAAISAADAGDPQVHCGAEVSVLINPGHLQQILINLCTNAAKYGVGATEIRVTRYGTRVRIHVMDAGTGVSADFRPLLFHRFGRADRVAGSAVGTGLGLYIVRGLARANHGEVWYEPNEPHGSSFTLELDDSGP